MTRTLLVVGTASHVGKSTVVAGLCRWLARRGVAVAPFKAQNMSNNARVALTPDGEWGEIGISQYVQANAAGVIPTTDMNPVLLKPRGGGESQVIIDGKAVGHYSAREFYETEWRPARRSAERAHRQLTDRHQVIIAEGAGSPAEVNLRSRDLANIETARFADADLLVVADIERGGAFASLYGTMELLPENIRDRVAGAIINKFRGDRSLLTDGIEDIEDRTGVPVLGVLPFDDPALPEEDSVTLPETGTLVLGTDDGTPAEHTVTVAVPRLGHLSNLPDLDPLASEPGVRVRIGPPADCCKDADAVVLPGSKNTVDDLQELRVAGLETELSAFDGPVVGLCGGYQMLGEQLSNAGIESVGDRELIEGFGLLPVQTTFRREKRVERVTRRIRGAGPLAGASGTVTGYEIHMGRTDVPDEVVSPIGPESAATSSVLGTYLHGLFENQTAREAFLETVFCEAGVERPNGSDAQRSPCDRAADLVDEYLDIEQLGLIQ